MLCKPEETPATEHRLMGAGERKQGRLSTQSRSTTGGGLFTSSISLVNRMSTVVHDGMKTLLMPVECNGQIIVHKSEEPLNDTAHRKHVLMSKQKCGIQHVHSTLQVVKETFIWGSEETET